ncbi:putative inactive peptidyl-prolyl cis-trans isomerase-like 6 isoform X2 [Brachyhypopomus gauderio]|uniref:putative inactive peptidyl-prolyl cis-trans isomerase-like 6 isoform X2 n=1 Tax=Brachyhypopomus gauderio TaxID=698409 RepID=UPI004041FC71
MASEIHLEIVGLMKVYNFHVAKSIAEGLKQKYPASFADPTIHPLLECDWQVYLNNKKKLLGDETELSKWAEKRWNFDLSQPCALYTALTEEYYTKHLRSTGHVFVYMDIEIGGEVVGRILFELFSDLCPKTCTNFKALCTGDAGLSQSGLTLCYKDCLFHRVVSNGWVQGGDPTGKGNGGESIYGPTFEDESFAVSHTKRGILGMANQGHHSNSSQFYITLQPALWMDRRYVAFGQAVEGAEALRKLEEVPTYNERPRVDCRIAACGLFDP